MSFGFGIGDFITITSLAFCAYSSLQDSTGSSADFQSLKMIRQSVGTTLVEAEINIKLNPGCLPKPLINAINSHLGSCFQALKAFDETTRKFEECLSHGSGGGSWKTRKSPRVIYRKLEWNTVKEGAKEVFNYIAKHINAIQVLLGVSNM
jgi:hypothetical protein